MSEALLGALRGVAPALAFGAANRTRVPEEVAVVILTSGSTGPPKEVALSASALISSAKASHNFLGAQLGQSWSLLLPTTHIAGVNVLVRALELGTPVLGIDAEVEYSAIVPTQLHRALHGDEKLLKHLKNALAVLIGGGATPRSLLELGRAAGVNLITTYGMTEMCGGCIYNNQLLPGLSVQIGEDRVIQLSGPSRAFGYLNDMNLWNASNTDEWFKTSDTGELVDGNLFVTGRIDDQIISGGEKISLSLIENFLNEKFSPRKFASFALPSVEWGEILAIASDQELVEEEIKSAIKSEFGAHATPKAFLIENRIPLNPMGKPERERLREIFERIRE